MLGLARTYTFKAVLFHKCLEALKCTAGITIDKTYDHYHACRFWKLDDVTIPIDPAAEKWGYTAEAARGMVLKKARW